MAKNTLILLVNYFDYFINHQVKSDKQINKEDYRKNLVDKIEVVSIFILAEMRKISYYNRYIKVY